MSLDGYPWLLMAVNDYEWLLMFNHISDCSFWHCYCDSAVTSRIASPVNIARCFQGINIEPRYFRGCIL